MHTRWARFGVLAAAAALLTGGGLAMSPLHVSAAPAGHFRMAQQSSGANDGETADGANGSENETAGETENGASGGDEADGVNCVQQGEHQGENAGC